MAAGLSERDVLILASNTTEGATKQRPTSGGQRIFENKQGSSALSLKLDQHNINQ